MVRATRSAGRAAGTRRGPRRASPSRRTADRARPKPGRLVDHRNRSVARRERHAAEGDVDARQGPLRAVDARGPPGKPRLAQDEETRPRDVDVQVHAVPIAPQRDDASRRRGRRNGGAGGTAARRRRIFERFASRVEIRRHDPRQRGDRVFDSFPAIDDVGPRHGVAPRRRARNARVGMRGQLVERRPRSPVDRECVGDAFARRVGLRVQGVEDHRRPHQDQRVAGVRRGDAVRKTSVAGEHGRGGANAAASCDP